MRIPYRVDHASMDWAADPDDPHGYERLRAAVDSFTLQLDDLGLGQFAAGLREAQRFVWIPSEWMGEIALALNAALSETQLPNGLREDMSSAVDAIRTGFRRVGDQPSF
jgi:hypothetical protein